ncbi:hypothetical protein PF005_g15997 [Phytophthora fragariae]|uniref:Uncharacterized protein n=1 Tax=Phytophthora fragariae TaxID=53985 RepID=A0A6A3H8L7_9STRA|nr:hypothetical protein PF003_g6189 [Phytophthora fragariae]KAE8937048.1 hypothetical protein PF009_g13030 [Phytophthora fragariae]KAE8965284.1 hypothetical protein PF011_g28353 [Phytophthora fragariae]KAE9090706.1 hypothetical protein PF010_g18488 [Phytophthora fragariae]KAE9098222.1 hypothetical protein PF007_g16349 [Phytophthora fragariae]
MRYDTSNKEACISLLSDLCAQFEQLVADLFEEFAQLLAARSRNNSNFGERSHLGHVSVPALVDDILSLVYAEPKYSPLRSTASALLLRRDESFERASQTLFRTFLEQLKQGRRNLWSHDQCVDVSAHLPTTAISTNAEASVSISTAKDPIPSRPAQLADLRHHEVAVPIRAGPSTNEWGRRWFLVPSSVSIVSLDIAPSDERNNVDLTSPNAPRDFSMLTAIALVRMLASVDVVLEGTRLTVGSSESVSQLPATSTSSTILELDGQLHAFKSFPNGWSVAAGSALLGDTYSISLYEGRVTDDGTSLDLLLFSLSTSPVQSQFAGPSGDRTVSVTHRLRARLVLGRGRREDEGCVSVFAEVCLAPSPEQPPDWRTNVDSEHFLDEMSVLRWTLETHATYVAWP